MENQSVLIGKRMREIRAVLEIPVSEMAKVTGVTEEEYLRHESGEVDNSFSFLYHCAERFGVDLADVPAVGDSLRDLQAAQAAGAKPWLVLTGKGQATKEAGKLPRGTKVFADLAAIAAELTG